MASVMNLGIRKPVIEADTSLLPYLTALYGSESGKITFESLCARIEAHRLPENNHPPAPLDQNDVVLITYADQFNQPGEPPLKTLNTFCQKYLKGLISSIHILPFYPFSSDDGFSVIDYRAVDQQKGSWQDVKYLGENYRLMFDAVINHISSQSKWFEHYLKGDPKFDNYFITVAPGTDLSQVVRPRIQPLLTSFNTAHGQQYLWTTFSTDQIDLNYSNPQVLLEILDLLLFYVENGAQIIRLDAIAYLWKEIGTSCIHLPQTHWVIQLMRAVLDRVAPYVLLITETNVPHKDNVAYFGDGFNEAQMVYNFALPPLVLHTIQTANTHRLTHWAAALTLPSQSTTYFNFLASHDGIGLNPARGILTDEEIEAIVQRTLSLGGFVSGKSNPDGTQSPYELNINYLDALSVPGKDEPTSLQVDRFIAAQAIMCAIVGVPGIYVHSLLGSRGWKDGVSKRGYPRAINRQKFEIPSLQSQLDDPDTLHSLILRSYKKMLRARASTSAFHPHGAQLVLDAGDALFTLLRISPDCQQTVLCVQNVSPEPQSLPLNLNKLNLPPGDWYDLIGENTIPIHNKNTLLLTPYQTLWLLPHQPIKY